jgi:predicted permease
MNPFDHIRDMLYGALTLGCLVSSLFFLRFWRQTRDRLFALFSAAFAILAINWIPLPFVPAVYESRELFYLLRLVAFLIILVAIVDKNRKRA